MLCLPAAMVAMAITGSGTGQTVLLDFYADWCGPCRSMMPTVEQLSAKGYPVQRINISTYPEMAQRFGITKIPCFVMMVNGQEATRWVGPTSLGHLEQICNLGRAAAAAPNTMMAGPAAPQQNYAATCTVPSLQAPPPQQSFAAQQAPAAQQLPVMPAVYNAMQSQPQRPQVSDAALLAASVRVRVEDPQGHSCGSGTIIDALPGGEALVLTCGHLFRDSQGKGKIDIDVFGPAPAAHVPGRVVSYDLERDVALIAFRPLGAVTVARVAPRGYRLQPGDAVASVGCNNGDDPTVQRSQVNKLDRFQDPVEIRLGHKIQEPHSPWNVEVAGQPTPGRSGGGLFSYDGMVIGVCNAADPQSREGMFAALGSIHSELDRQRLASLYQQPIAPPTLVPALDASPTRPGASADPRMLAASDPFAARGGTPQVRIPSEQPPQPAAGMASVAAAPSAPNNQPARMTGSEQSTLDTIHQKVREGSEVVCIIRDRNDPKSNSQVITLDRASPLFVNQLAHDAYGPELLHPTAMDLAKPRTPILEWDAGSGWIHQNPLPR